MSRIDGRLTGEMQLELQSMHSQIKKARARRYKYGLLSAKLASSTLFFSFASSFGGLKTQQCTLAQSATFVCQTWRRRLITLKDPATCQDPKTALRLHHGAVPRKTAVATTTTHQCDWKGWRGTCRHLSVALMAWRQGCSQNSQHS